MRFLRILSVVVLCICPFFAHASVVLNEVAWMGTSVSANDEWIELYNSGSDIQDVTGWTLSGGSLSVTLSGSIAGQSYFLLERTDDTSVTTHTADQIFTGAISNSGVLLQLKNAIGEVVDAVDGRNNWALGGDNETKHTLQRNGQSWLTAVSTPRASNATPPPKPIVTEKSKEQSVAAAAEPVTMSSPKNENKEATSTASDKNANYSLVDASNRDTPTASMLPWFLGVIALVGAAAAGILLNRRPLLEDEFEITE